MHENVLFRPPFGKMTSKQIFKLKKKYKLILWDILSYDFKEKNPTKLKNNVLNNVSDGSIIVFHNNTKSYNLLKETLRDIIIELKKWAILFLALGSNTKVIKTLLICLVNMIIFVSN